jgi:putative acetyltransferase
VTFAIRRYAEADHAAVRELFIRVNRELAPPALRAAFEDYVTVSLREEVDRLADYYAGKQGAFFVAHAALLFPEKPELVSRENLHKS